MHFVDQVRITVKAGDGGRGCVSYAQPPYTRHPYPDGGNGGDGGDVVILTNSNIATLLDFQFRHEFKAQRGGHGSSNTKHGKRGIDHIIRVPVGTVLHEETTGTIIRDLTEPNESLVIVKGGRGGMGNGVFAKMLKSSRRIHVAEKYETEEDAARGGLGEKKNLQLELKLIADVGIVGVPNAGKSSLLARISTARPKVANYPFTTRYPVLGVVQVINREPFVACDIPGLIEGAHDGKGLGMQFLRHIERTKILIHVVDISGLDGSDPIKVYRQLNEELGAYDPTLPGKPQLVVANKLDIPEAKERLALFERSVKVNVWPISCATGKGIPALLSGVADALKSMSDSQVS